MKDRMRRLREAWKHSVVFISLSVLWSAGCSSFTVKQSSQSQPDFALQASPATASLTAGGATQSIALTATAVAGFSGSVQVTIAGLPVGVTAAPSALTL